MILLCGLFLLFCVLEMIGVLISRNTESSARASDTAGVSFLPSMLLTTLGGIGTTFFFALSIARLCFVIQEETFSTELVVLLVALALGGVLVLVTGIIATVKASRHNEQHSNKMGASFLVIATGVVMLLIDGVGWFYFFTR